MRVLLFILVLASNVAFGQDWTKGLAKELYESLDNPNDTIYIGDRLKLEKIGGRNCTTDQVIFSYTSQAGIKTEIQIDKDSFDPTKHKLDIRQNLVDGQFAYGNDATMPITEISSFTIKWNGQEITIPRNAYANLYQPWLCSTEAYLKEDNLYVYLKGSDAAGSYSAKFIFDKNQYITRIVETCEMVEGYGFLDVTTNPAR